MLFIKHLQRSEWIFRSSRGQDKEGKLGDISPLCRKARTRQLKGEDISLKWLDGGDQGREGVGNQTDLKVPYSVREELLD